jgi:hypothetical protein
MRVDTPKSEVEGEAAGLSTAASQATEKPLNKQDEDETLGESEDEDRKAHVVKYQQEAAFPFEIGDTVWIMKPGYRAPLGEFRITKAYANDMFQLESCATSVAHPELVAGNDLRRNI